MIGLEYAQVRVIYVQRWGGRMGVGEGRGGEDRNAGRGRGPESGEERREYVCYWVSLGGQVRGKKCCRRLGIGRGGEGGCWIWC